MRFLAPITLALPLAVASSPAYAAQSLAFDIPAGRLDTALVLFARQAGLSINTAIPGLAAAQTSGLKGRYSVNGGLRRLLRGTGFDFRIVGDMVAIFRAAAPAQRPAPQIAERPPTREAPPAPIIVTAAKRDTLLIDYPGSAHVATLDFADSLRFGGRGSETLLRDLPNLTSTDLGSGRNKLFIRGIADSSFNGQNQSTIAEYFGESQLIYSAPDPDLALYDIARVEVIEGPQGTLYGAGSLGGVIRIEPNAPDPKATMVSGSLGLSATDGATGYDAAVVGNVPLGTTSALRAVGYRVLRPGYIDDPTRGASDINLTSLWGLRATVHVEPLRHFALEGGVVIQNLESRDGQYTNSGRNDLIRTSTLAQPFDNDYRLGFVTARAMLGFADLVSNTALIDQTIDTTFDATLPAATTPRVYVDDTRVRLLTHETRLSGTGGLFTSWVLGVSVLDNLDRVERSLGDPAAPQVISESRDETFEAALFGEASYALTNTLALTGGARISYNRQADEIGTLQPDSDYEPRRIAWRFLPTAALSWKPGDDWLVYARYHEGYRPGSQRIVGASGDQQVVQFNPDEIRTAEVGARYGARAQSQLYAEIAFASSRWQDVQADLVTSDGFPYLANIGDGYVRYASARIGWRPLPGLDLDASGFVTSSQLDRPAPGFTNTGDGDLPNIADSGGGIGARYTTTLGPATLHLDGSVTYVGTSFLGNGTLFERKQGDYLDTTLGARIAWRRWGLSVDAENLLDSRANRFSFGNPFTFSSEDQRTPLRPRTIRIGIDARF